MGEFNKEEILDEKIKEKLKKDVYISEKANKVFDKFSSGNFNISELENERIKIEEKGCGINMKNVNKENNNGEIKKSNVIVFKRIMSVAACTLVLATGVGIGANVKFNFKNTQNEGGNVAENGNVVIEQQNVQGQISAAAQTDYNAVMDEFINKKIATILATRTTKHNSITGFEEIISESYELSSNINNGIYTILDKLKTVKPDNIEDLGVKGFLTRLDESVEISYTNGYVFHFVYNDESNILYVHLQRGQESFVYSYYDKDVIKEIAKIMSENKVKKNEYIELDSTYYSVKIPKDWEGKYETKVYTNYEKGITYDVIVRKDTKEEICGLLIFRGGESYRNYNLDMGVSYKGKYGGYSCYFARKTVTPSLEKYFSNNINKQIMEITDNMKLKDMETQLDNDYNLYYQNNPNASVIDATQTYGGEYFNCDLLASWKPELLNNIDDATYKLSPDDIYCKIEALHNNQYVTVFSIMISEKNDYSESNWRFIGETINNKKMYLMRNYVCSKEDGNNYTEEDYKFEKEVIKAMENFRVIYRARSESSNAFKDIKGRYFIRGEAGTNYRSYLYYIRDGYIYRVSLVDGFPEVIIASSAGSLEYNEKEHKIYAQPKNGEDFTNNIAINDEYIVFCQ